MRYKKKTLVYVGMYYWTTMLWKWTEFYSACQPEEHFQ